MCDQFHASIAAGLLRWRHRARMLVSQRFGVATANAHCANCGSRNRFMSDGVGHTRHHGQLRSAVPNVDTAVLGPRNRRESDEHTEGGGSDEARGLSI